MASLEELKEVRLKKKAILEEKGINPYPSDTHQTHTLKEVIDSFEKEKEVVIVGRIMSLRGQGAILFVDLFDGTGKFQAVFKKDEGVSYTGNKADGFDLFSETADIADFIEIKGKLFVTQRGVNSIQVSGWRMLTKSMLPIPNEFYGLKDEEEKLRKRYLDILMNEDVREMFEKRSSFWRTARRFFEDKGFMEVETPTLELTTGGAEARPFKTHHNDFDLDVFLRISVGELWQKRLMAAGFPKVFEIGRVYRNEGSSSEHVQEFTNLECYGAYINLDSGKELVKELYIKLAQDTFGTTAFSTRGHSFDLSDEWIDVDYVGEVEKQTGINVLSATEEEMESALKKLGVKFEGKNRERMTDSLWKYCRRNIAGPAFLINHPKLVAPLSKDLEGEEGKTEMFQVILAGSEIGRAHAELNDPVEQEKRLNTQQDLIDRGDDEAMMKDDEFIEMLDHGMPPTFGFGFGERLFAFLADKPLRETQLFPLVKPNKDK